MLTLLRGHGADTVLVMFNLTDDETERLLPLARGGPGVAAPGQAWRNLLEPEAPELGAGAQVSIAPWGFVVYRLGSCDTAAPKEASQ